MVANLGGRLTNLLLTTGFVNGYDVVCWVNNDQYGCNSQNLLVTISPGRDPGVFLANLLNRRANPFEQGTPGQESKMRTVVPFGQFVEQMIDEAENQPTNNEPIDPTPPDHSPEPNRFPDDAI